MSYEALGKHAHSAFWDALEKSPDVGARTDWWRLSSSQCSAWTAAVKAAVEASDKARGNEPVCEEKRNNRPFSFYADINFCCPFCDSYLLRDSANLRVLQHPYVPTCPHSNKKFAASFISLEEIG